MKSTMRIDFHHENPGQAGFEPVIRIRVVESEDTRDRLLKTFFQKLGGESSWLYVNYLPSQDGQDIQLTPVIPQQLPETLNIIHKRIVDSGNVLISGLLPSHLQIDDKCLYTTDSEVLTNPFNPKQFEGTITGVRFTKSKVLYDILNTNLEETRDVVSDNVVPYPKNVPINLEGK